MCLSYTARTSDERRPAAQIRTLAWPAAGPARLTEGEARRPVPYAEIWSQTALIPATPDPGLLEDLDAVLPLELWKRRALAPVAGSATKFELAAPADLAQVVPPEAGAFLAGTAAYGSAAPVLGAPPAPATGYTPVLEDAGGAVYPMDSDLWLADARRATVEFPWGVPASVALPLTLTFFKYIGTTGGIIPDPLPISTLYVSTIDVQIPGIPLSIGAANPSSIALGAPSTPLYVDGYVLPQQSLSAAFGADAWTTPVSGLLTTPIQYGGTWEEMADHAAAWTPNNPSAGAMRFDLPYDVTYGFHFTSYLITAAGGASVPYFQAQSSSDGVAWADLDHARTRRFLSGGPGTDVGSLTLFACETLNSAGVRYLRVIVGSDSNTPRYTVENVYLILDPM